MARSLSGAVALSLIWKLGRHAVDGRGVVDDAHDEGQACNRGQEAEEAAALEPRQAVGMTHRAGR